MKERYRLITDKTMNLMQQHGITVDELSKIMGVSKDKINDILEGESVKKGLANDFSNLFDVKVEDIFNKFCVTAPTTHPVSSDSDSPNHVNITWVGNYAKKSNLSNREIAEKSGVHIKNIQKYTSGARKRATAENAYKIAEAFGITWEDMISNNIDTPAVKEKVFVENPDTDIINKIEDVRVELEKNRIEIEKLVNRKSWWRRWFG